MFICFSLFLSRYIPESHRATVTNWFRVPMNLLTCGALLTVNLPSVAADKRAVFAMCAIALGGGAAAASAFASATEEKESSEIDKKKGR